MATKEKKIKRRVRNAYLVSTVSIALVLFLLGAVSYLILNAREASDDLKENMTVSVWLKDGLSQTQRNTVENRLKAFPDVKEVSYTSKEEAAETYKAYMDSDFEGFLGENPLPASFEVTLNAQYSNVDSVKVFDVRVSKWDEVDDVLYQAGIIEEVAVNIQKFNLVLLFFGCTLLLISLILINNTIRMTIFSKRSVINTMKLVGATKGFILRPFLWKAVAQGCYAAILASLLVCAIIYGLNAGIPEAGFIKDLSRLSYIFAGILIVGIVISFLFTYAAVSKYVRLNAQRIYIY